MTTEKTLRGRAIKLLLIPLLLLLIPVIVVWMLCRFLIRVMILVTIWLTWSTQGVTMLIVYSNSPHWQKYFEKGLLPLVEPKSKVLNWSDHLTWPINIKMIAFYRFAGERDFNPMIIFFRPFRWPTTLRFFQPFRDAKHGKTKPLCNLEKNLSDRLCIPIDLKQFHPRKSV